LWAERLLAPLIERAEFGDFDEEANPPDVLKTGQKYRQIRMQLTSGSLISH